MKSRPFQLENLYLSPRNKQADTARKIYMNGCLQPKTTRNQQNKSTKGIIKQLDFKKSLSKLRNKMSHDPLSFSDRKSSQKENILKRDVSVKQRLFKQKSIIFKSNTKHSHTSRMFSQTSRLSKHPQKSQKSTMLSELQNASVRLQKQKQLQKLHQSGKNCRVVIIQGTNQQQHYVQVDKIGDIMTYLNKEYPRYKYYKSIPSQLTIDYFLMEGTIDGKFLNGQSLYLKPCGRTNNSLDEKQQVGLQSFQIIKLIGSGGFSKVYLCRFKQDGKFYAMKVIDKEVIVKNKKKKIIANERNIMKAAEHAFVIDMKFAFQSEKFLVFVMQYCAGGQLFGLIKKYRRIEEQMARFYIIEILLGLSYLHSQKVVYRDIKPENILLCQDGHVKIADLGLAKPDMFEGQLAYSFCGSPQYMSPQMILQVGHTYPVDYYCMGALLYELLTGLPPYYSRDPNQIYEAVLSEELTFPSDVQLTPQCKSLLRGLLCKEPKQRLGSLHGIKQILAHPWFGKNQYKKFLQKQMTPPVNFNSIAKVNLDNYTDEQKNKRKFNKLKNNKKFKRKSLKKEKNPEQNHKQRSSKQKVKLSQRDLSVKRKVISGKKAGQNTSRDSKKQSSIQKQNYMNLDHQDGIKLKFGGNTTSSIKKLTNRGSHTKLFNRKLNNSNSNIDKTCFKNILNSERH